MSVVRNMTKFQSLIDNDHVEIPIVKRQKVEECQVEPKALHK